MIERGTSVIALFSPLTDNEIQVDRVFSVSQRMFDQFEIDDTINNSIGSIL